MLPLKNEVLISTVQELSLTNENLASFKQNLIHTLFFSLEEAQYQSLNTDELRTQSNEMKRVLFLILLQRLVILELLNKPDGASSYTNTDNRLNISEIINDLKSRMIKNPELRNKDKEAGVKQTTGMHRHDYDFHFNFILKEWNSFVVDGVEGEIICRAGDSYFLPSRILHNEIGASDLSLIHI